MAPPTRYDSVAMGLHWLIAVLILADFALAESFSHFNPGDALYLASAYDLHMATGALVLLLSVARVGWRFVHQRPPLPPMSGALRALARLSHALLYVLMIGVPLAGWLVMSLRRQVTSVFGLFSWVWPSVSALHRLPHAQRQVLHDSLLSLHIWVGYAGLCLVGLHVAAALYHQFLRRDDVLSRMLPRISRARQRGATAPEVRQPWP